MKLLEVLLWVGCACAASNPKSGVEQPESLASDFPKSFHPVQTQNWLINQAVNTLVSQAINYIRLVVNNGSDLFGVPPLDPFTLEHFHIKIPAGIINLDVELIDVYTTGFGGFITHGSKLDIRSLALELDFSVPRVEIKSKYELSGEMFTVIPLYGKGDAEFIVESFRVHAMLHLRQSDIKESVIIDKAEDIFFEIPHFQSNLTGMIGGDDIEAIINMFVEEFLIDYVNRFRGAISIVVGRAVVAILNPMLNQLDTWKYLAPFVPINL